MTNSYQSDHVRSWIGHTVVDANGDKVGKIEDVYEDHDGSGPEWFAIASGFFGSKMSFAPVNGSTADGDTLRLPWTKDQIKDSPHFEGDDIDDGGSLYQHYGMGYGDEAVDLDTVDRSSATDTSRKAGLDDDAMTRSEEEVNVSTRQREAGRVRLRKWVETENVNVTVPVRREVARLVTEPVAGRAVSGSEITEGEVDVVLHEEEVVVDKKVVAKERVRLETDTVTDERVVDEQVRKEHIEMETDGTDNVDRDIDRR